MDAEERALLAAISSTPDDDSTRLVYSDWLQEHDQPERAEYIRLSIQLANLRYGDPNFEADEKRLLALRRPLVEQFHKQWEREFASRFPANRVVWFGFGRGFVEQVRCSVKYFLDNAEQLFREAPLLGLWATSLTARTAGRLVSSAWFRRLKRLQIIDRGAALALLDNTAPEISTLNFSSAPDFRCYQATNTATHWEPVALCLATHQGLKSVAKIDLECCGIGDAGGLALAESRHLNPEVLNLLGNGLSEPTRLALRARYGKCVWLDLVDCKGCLRRDL